MVTWSTPDWGSAFRSKREKSSQLPEELLQRAGAQAGKTVKTLNPQTEWPGDILHSYPTLFSLLFYITSHGGNSLYSVTDADVLKTVHIVPSR